jgi:hypothetical protein
MTGKIQRFGRAAQIRGLLAALPAGATDEQLLAAGLECSIKQLNNSLNAMCDSEQVRSTTVAGNRVWSLTTAMLKHMRGDSNGAEPSRQSAARVMRSAPTGSNNSTTVLHKDEERQKLAHLVRAFQKAGGKIEVLGNTGIRPCLSRRQINDASADARNRHIKGDGARATPASLSTVTPPRSLRTQLTKDDP